MDEIRLSSEPTTFVSLRGLAVLSPTQGAIAKLACAKSFRLTYSSQCPKHIDTAADVVRFGASVKIECTSCGASGTLTGAEMVKACGAGPAAGCCEATALLKV